MFAHTANASTLDSSGASYGGIPEMDDSGASDDLFGKRKKKKAAEDAHRAYCQDLKALMAANSASSKGIYAGEENAKTRAIYQQAKDAYYEAGCDAVLAK